MRAVGALHAALERLPAGYEPDQNSLFVQVTDPSYLIAELPGLVRHYGLAASTALYWYHVYGQPVISADGLAASRAAMGEARPWAAGEDELWAAGLVWEGLRRLATTLELLGTAAQIQDPLPEPG